MKKLILLAALLLSACGTETKQETIEQPVTSNFEIEFGVDDYASLKYLLKALPIINAHSQKIVYYASHYDSSQKIDLLYLQSMGHEIGNHTLMHDYAPTTIKQNGVDGYVDYVLEYNQIMIDDGLEVKKFAYPYGAGETSVDKVLLETFDTVRYTTSLYDDSITLSITPKAVMIDTFNYDEEEIKRVILKAKKQDKKVYFVFHAITDSYGGKYHITIEQFTRLMQIASDYT